MKQGCLLHILAKNCIYVTELNNELTLIWVGHITLMGPGEGAGDLTADGVSLTEGDAREVGRTSNTDSESRFTSAIDSEGREMDVIKIAWLDKSSAKVVGEDRCTVADMSLVVTKEDDPLMKVLLMNKVEYDKTSVVVSFTDEGLGVISDVGCGLMERVVMGSETLPGIASVVGIFPVTRKVARKESPYVSEGTKVKSSDVSNWINESEIVSEGIKVISVTDCEIATQKSWRDGIVSALYAHKTTITL